MEQFDNNAESSPLLQSYGVDRAVANSPSERIRKLRESMGVSEEDLSSSPEVQAQKTSDKANTLSGYVDSTLDTFGSIGHGILKSTQSMANTVLDVTDWVDNNLGTNVIGPERISFLTDPRNVHAPQTAGGQFASKISQFLLPFSGANKVVQTTKALSGVAPIIKGAISGSVADYLSFDENEERLSNLVQEVPMLQNPITEYLATNPKDTQAESKFKTVLEGALIGMGMETLVEGVYKGVKFYRDRSVAKSVISDSDQAIRKIDNTKIGKEAEVSADGTKGISPIEEEITKVKSDIKTQRPSQKQIDVSPLQQAQALPKELVEKAMDDVALPPSIRSMIDLNKVDFEADDAIEQVAKQFRSVFDERKRGIIPDEDVLKMATNLGLSEDDVLLRVAGKAFNAEEQMAALIIRNAAIEQTVSMSGKIASGNYTKQELAAAILQLEKTQSIAIEAAASASEAGRSLRQNRLDLSGGNAKNSRIVERLIKNGGGGEMSAVTLFKRIDAMSKKEIDELFKLKPGGLLSKATFELFINNILSGPKTHLTNLVSNSSVAIMSAPERKVAEMFSQRYMKKSKEAIPSVFSGEASSMLSGVMQGLSDGMNLIRLQAKEAKINIKGVLDGKSLPPMKRVNSKMDEGGSVLNASTLVPESGFDESGELNFLGKTIELLGYGVTSPTRLLSTSDEFFKAVNFSMEKGAQATRFANLEGIAKNWSPEQVQNRISELIKNPTKEIKARASHAADVNTFTQQLKEGSWAANLDRLMKTEVNTIAGSFQPLRVITPFVKTPMNIVEYQISRSPFPLAFEKTRIALQEGGRNADLIKSKMAVGTSMMALGGILTYNGFVTGKGPANIDMKKFMKSNGWQENSIKIPTPEGEVFVKYDRLDPFGALLGFSADLSLLAEELGNSFMDEEDQENQVKFQEALASAVGTLTEFFTPDFMMDSMSNFTEMLTGEDKGRKARQFISNFGSNLVPMSALLRSIEGTVDPTMRETRFDENQVGIFEETFNRVVSTIPGLSDALPPKRNLFGEPIMAVGSISPFTLSHKEDDLVVDTMIELGMDSIMSGTKAPKGQSFLTVAMPEKVIRRQGIPFRLDAEQYDKFVQLSAGIGLFATDVPLKKALETEIKNDYPQAQSFSRGKVTDEGKRLSLKNIINQYRKLAREQLLAEEPSIMDSVLAEKLTQEAVITGQ